MANILSKTSETAPASGAVAYIVNDPTGTPADRKATLGNIITKAHGLSDSTVVGVSSGVLTSGVDVAVADGGTGASTAAGARTNLGVAIGSNVQAYDAQLDDVAAISPGKGKVIVSNATNIVALAAGTDGQILTADAAETAGVKWSTPAGAGDTSTNTSSSVDSEVVVFSGTSGKLLKRATGSGIAKLTSGVLSTATSGTDYAPATSGSGILKGDGSGGFSTASAGTDYYNPGGTDVAIADGGTGASTKAAAFDALSPMTTSGDIIYGGASGTGTRLAKGSDGQVLTLASGVPSWAAASSGGQSLVTKVVAASGGDYTTLGAALAAASDGWTIYVRSGTYVESGNVTSTNANLHIIGDGRETALIQLDGTTMTFSGAGVQIDNLGFTMTTGSLSMTGARVVFDSCKLVSTGVPAAVAAANFASLYGSITNSHLETTSTGARTVSLFRFAGDYQTISDNHFLINTQSTTLGGVNLVNPSLFQNNLVRVITSGNLSTGLGISNGGDGSIISGNTLLGFGATTYTIRATSRCTIADNVTYASDGGLRTIFTTASGTTIIGNYLRPSGNSSYGVYVDASNCVVSSNYMETDSVTTSFGVFVNSSRDNTRIVGNALTAFGTGVGVNASSCDNTVINGNSFDSNTTAITDSGTGTVIQGNAGLDANLTKNYVRMKNTSGATINAGNLVIFKSVAAGDEVTTTTTGGDSKVFGMAVASIANNAYGLIQVAGKTTLMTVNGTTDIAIGDFISTFTAAGIGQKASAGQTAIAIALEAYTTDDSSGVIDALIISPRVI